MMVRWMCGVTFKNKKSSEELREYLGIESVTDVMRRGRLRWFEHIERKSKDDWVLACTYIEFVGDRNRSRGKKTWRECVNDDMKKLGLKKEEEQDRLAWRRGILGKRLTLASTEK